MVAVRSWVMETRGDYQADASADEPAADATPEKVVPMRTYTKVYNDYYEPLWPIIGPFRNFVLQYLIRQTWGFHRDAARIPLGTISTTLKLSRHVVINALRDLEAWRIIASDAPDLGRTQVRTYRMLPPEQWTLPIQTSASDALVEKPKRTSARHALVTPQTSADNALDDLQTSASHAPIKRKPEKKENQRKENDANASSDANAPTPRKSSSSKRQPKAETPEQKERRIAEAVYVTDLCNRVKSFLNGAKSPKSGEDRAGGHWFYTAGIDDTPADPEQVMALYAAVKRVPFYRGKYLTLQSITTYWPAWQANPADVKQAVADEQRKTEYARAAANGHKPQRPAGREQTYAKTGEDMAPKGWN